MSDIRITSFSTISSHPRSSGDIAVGKFACEVHGVVLTRLTLVQRAGGGFDLSWPCAGRSDAIYHITDPDLRDGILKRAVVAYRALTGEAAEAPHG